MADRMSHVVMMSGGIGSWAAAKRVAASHGTVNLTLLFTDTLMEDADTYRFLIEGAANVMRRSGRLDGVLELARETPPSDSPLRMAWLTRLRSRATDAIPGLVWLSRGKTIWQVFKEERFLGNSRVDPCSKILKRTLADSWLKANHTPDSVVVYVGIDWSEEHRFTRLAERKLPWIYKAPLCDAPYLDKFALHAWAESEGIAKQRLYKTGAAHANCGGGCVKMGVGGFARLLAADPAEFARWEKNEIAMRSELGDVTILRDRANGQTVPLPLFQLRKNIEAGQQPDLFDIGGCGCFVDAEDAA